MGKKLDSFIDSNGISELLSRDTPLSLDRADSFYFIKKGVVDLFAAKTIDGAPVGSRRRLFSLTRGSFIFPLFCELRELLLDSENSKHSFIGVPVGNVELTALSFDKLDALFLESDKDLMDELIVLLDSWIKLLYSALKIETDSELVTCLCEGSNTLTSKSMMKTGGEILWTSDRSELAVKGKEFLDFEDEFKLIPLSGKSIFQVKNDCIIETWATRDLARDGLLKKALLNFNIFAAELLEYWYLNSDYEEAKAYKNALIEEEKIINDTCRKLTGIFTSTPLDEQSELKQNDIFAAIKRVGAFLNIKFTKPPEIEGMDLSPDMIVKRISNSSNIRSRRVSFGEHWYKNDSGPLLGFFKDSSSPVAMIPKKNRGYYFYEAKNKLNVAIDQKNAELFEKFAYCFYRPLGGDKVSFKDLLQFSVFGNKKNFVFVIVIGLISAVFGLVIPWSTGFIFDHIIPEADRVQLLQISLIIIVCTTIIALLGFVKNMTILSFSTRTSYALQNALWDRLLALPVNFFRNYTSGDLAQRSYGISRIHSMIDATLINTLLNTLFSVGFLFMLFYYSVSLAFVAVFLSLAFVFTSTVFSLLVLKYQKKLVALEGDVSGLVYQLISAVSKIRLCGAENRVLSKWAEKFYSKKSLSYRSGFISNILSVISSFFPILSAMIIIAWLIFGAKESQMSAGSFMAFNTAYISFQSSLLSFSSSFIQMLSALPFYRRMKPIFETKPELSENKVIPKKLTGKIEINHVSFRYDEKSDDVLKDVSISCEPGEYIAIVGKSGSGKSTLMRLLLGFEKTERGSIYYDNYDISMLDIRELRHHLGVVLQNSSLLQGSIFENIAGNSPLTSDEAWEAARMAGLEDDIKEMPMGIHTLITAGGGTISGGQKQRLIIARALVRKPGIILFDEATSALDNKTQSIVSETIDRLNVTRVIIAHRLSTIVNADRIYVMDAGRVVQTGTYNELLSQEGKFKELVIRQTI